MPIARFHRLKIHETRAQTADAMTVSFEVPAALRDAYRFTQGQYLSLRTWIDEEEIRRSYSICNSVSAYNEHGVLRVGIKRIHGGRFSNWANDTLVPGAEIDVMTPQGRFFVALDPARARHYLGIAGGSGITPMLSLIETSLETEPRSSFTLIYGNRDTNAIMFLEEIEGLKNRFVARFARAHVLSDEPHEIDIFNGLLDRDRCAELVDALAPRDGFDHAFVCGPAPMMDAAESALRARAMSAQQISIERFGTPSPPASQPASAPSATQDAPAALVTLLIDGKERVLRVPFDGVSILDAGLRSGANLPYSCKGGVCCTCRAKVLDGEVRMDRNYTLEDWEIARGFVLSCQAHPVSAQVRISYDER